MSIFHIIAFCEMFEMGQAAPRCAANADPECCSSSILGRNWPAKDVFHEKYGVGSIVKNSCVGYTCLVFPREGSARNQVCEMTLRNINAMFFDRRVDTREMYKENVLSISHANIVRSYGFYQTASMYCAIHDYCQGGNLSDLAEDRKRSIRFGGKQFRDYQYRVGSYLYQACNGLLHLHSLGYVHRNVKCSTIQFTDTSRSTVALAGLGYIAHVNDPGQVPASREIIYAAPEVLRGDLSAPPMDMYAVGICGYILLTGELPGKDCILEGSEVVRFITHTTMGSGSNVEVTPGESPDFEERDTAQPLKPIDEDTAQLASEIDLQSDDPESAVPRLEAALANGFQLPKSLRGVMDRARGCIAGLLDPDPQKLGVGKSPNQGSRVLCVSARFGKMFQFTE